MGCCILGHKGGGKGQTGGGADTAQVFLSLCAAAESVTGILKKQMHLAHTSF